MWPMAIRARTIFEDGIANVRIGHQFFWHLKAEMHDPSISARYGVLLQEYVKLCGPYRGELLRMNDRHGRDFCFGPTHEEVITQIAKSEIKSYKQLPINLFQIQTKFRDEIRPRFGVMRSREFIMKDAYSFHIDQASQEQPAHVEDQMREDC